MQDEVEPKSRWCSCPQVALQGHCMCCLTFRCLWSVEVGVAVVAVAGKDVFFRSRRSIYSSDFGRWLLLFRTLYWTFHVGGLNMNVIFWRNAGSRYKLYLDVIYWHLQKCMKGPSWTLRSSARNIPTLAMSDGSLYRIWWPGRTCRVWPSLACGSAYISCFLYK